MKNQQIDKIFMKEALQEAKKAYKEEEVPVGAVIVFNEEIIGRGRNRSVKNNDPSSHAEVEAIRNASNRLSEGWATGVFLDGTRQENGRVNDPKAGAALLAARTGSPILPVAIVNSHRAFPKGSLLPRFVSIHLRVGELIQPPKTRKREDLTSTTKEIQRSINSMLDKGQIKKI